MPADGDPAHEPLQCPSAPAVDGARVLGVVVGPGLAYLPRPVSLPAAALREAGGRATALFRFTLPCSQGACANYGSGSCQLIGRFLEPGIGSEQLVTEDPLPHCAIRARCQWFRDAGRDACSVCPSVRHFSAVRESQPTT
jgi:hypothetical protein